MTREPSSGGSHPPAATTATGAVNVPLSVCTTAPSPAGAASRRVTGVSKRTSAPRPAARRSIAAIARSGSTTPESAWNMTGPVPAKEK